MTLTPARESAVVAADPASPANATRSLAATAAGIGGGRDLPRAVLERAALCVLDLLGVAIAGADTATASVARSVAAAEFGGADATVLADGTRLSATGAALANATAGHALDFDDVSVPGGHPSTVVVPAALAVAEQLDCSGAKLLAAVVTGLEVQCLLGEMVGPSHYARGFHTTATLGTFAAAAAAAALRGLDEAAFATALGIAGTLAAGLKEVFGSDCKPLHAGRAAANGILAAALADAGFTTGEDVLGGPQGFAATQSDGPIDLSVLSRPSQGKWHTLEIDFKQHAACYLTHAAINAVDGLRRAGRLDADRLEQLEITVPPLHFGVCNIADPTTGLEGKFSLRHTAALALTGRGTGQAAFSDDMATDPELVELRGRVRVVGDESLPVTAARVRADLRDGSTVEASWDMASQPADLEDRLRAKFLSNATPALGAQRANALLSTVLALVDGDIDARALVSAAR